MRARYPDCEGTVVRDGAGIRYERYGRGRPAIMLLPTWALVHSQHWKMQVAYLARHFTVVCFDGRASGGSGRPPEPAVYTDVRFASDAMTVMDAAGIETAVLVSVSCGALWALRLGAEYPDRVLGSVFIAPTAPLVPPLAERRVQRFGEMLDDPVGWQTYNARYWKARYPEFVEFFTGRIFTEPHSTKQIEDVIGWALEIDGETLARCTGGMLVTLAGSGHFPHVRDPVRVNVLIKQFADRFGR